MKTALVLEGGAMRGIYTSGVLDVFLDHGIRFDAVFGVSAGAIHGATYVAEQNRRNIRYYKKYRSDKRFMGMHSLFTTGDIVGKDFCYRQIPDELDPFDYDTFKNSKTKFYAVCTDVLSGKPIYVHITDLRTQMEFLRASASMPIVSNYVYVGPRLMLDGGVTDSIPVRAAMKLGYDKIVVVQTREEGYVKQSEDNFVARHMYGHLTGFYNAIRNRHKMYNAQLRDVKELAENGTIAAIRPSRAMNIGRLEKDVNKIEAMYQLGRYDAENNIDRIIEYLEVK